MGRPRKINPEPPPPAQVTFVNVPLDADAYYVHSSLSDVERTRLRLAWEKMNESLDKKKVLLLLPADMTLKQMHSEVLQQWIEKCTDILLERGHEVRGM